MSYLILTKVRLRKIGVCSLFVFLLSCSQLSLSPSEQKASPPILVQAQLLYGNSKPEAAKALIKEYLANNNLQPIDIKAAYSLMASIYFSMQEYKLARDHYAMAKSIFSEDFTALHRYWSAALLADSDQATRSRIISEITQLALDPNTSPNGLLAAYSGYGYLWDSKGKTNVLEKLLEASPTKMLNEQLPHLLMQEMISARSIEKSLTYSSQFYSRFADHVNLPILTLLLFHKSLQAEHFEAIVSEYTARQSYDPYLEYQISRFLLYNKKDQTGSYQRSQVLVNHIETDKLRKCPKDTTLPTCRFFRNKLVGDSFRLHAILLLKRGLPGEAMKYASKATKALPESAHVWTTYSKLLFDQKRVTEADAALTTALNLNPNLQPSLDLFLKYNKIKAISDVQAKRLIAQEQQIPYFSDATKDAGLEKVKATRIAWGDVNNDGYEDLLFDGAKLMLNKHGQGFEDVTQKAGLTSANKPSGGLLVDYDNDGWLDVLSIGKTSVLYRNNGDTRFSVTHSFNTTSPKNTEAASWGDFNNDGYVDLYLANYEKPGTERAICDHDQLFINKKGKAFSDRSQLLHDSDPYRLCSRGVLWSDLNQDGIQEIVVSSYRLQSNRVLMQVSDNELIDIAKPSNYQPGLKGHSIAAITADFNGDGQTDIYQTNLAHPRYLQYSDTSHLYINHSSEEKILFSVAENTGITFDETNADLTSADFDNDGDLDLFISSIYSKRNSSLYLNDGKGHFRNISWLSNTQTSNTWGTASADFDNDGDIDILVASMEGVRLLKNELNTQNSLKVTVASSKCQRNGVGMKLWLTKGLDTYFREIQAGKGTGTQDSASITFGLGDYQGKLSLRALNTCGNDYHWSGSSDDKSITIP